MKRQFKLNKRLKQFLILFILINFFILKVVLIEASTTNQNSTGITLFFEKVINKVNPTKLINFIFKPQCGDGVCNIFEKIKFKLFRTCPNDCFPDNKDIYCNSNNDCPNFRPNCINNTCKKTNASLMSITNITNLSCSTNLDCPKNKPYCIKGLCAIKRFECMNNDDCPTNKSICTISNICVECLTNNDCPQKYFCSNQECIFASGGWSNSGGSSSYDSGSSSPATELKHPYMFFDNSELTKLRNKASNTTINSYGINMNNSFEIIQNKAEGYLSDMSYSNTFICQNGSSTNIAYSYILSNQTPPNQTCDICCPWTSITNSMETRINYLAFTYAITQDKKYLNQTRDILLNVSDWVRWHDPSKSTNIGLSTATLLRSFAFAYDIIYQDLTENERIKIQNAMITKGIEPLKTSLNDTLDSSPNWRPITNGQAAYITALGMGAVALYEDIDFMDNYSEFARNLTENYLENQERTGGMYEGVTYGQQAVEYIIKFGEPLRRIGGADILAYNFSKRVWNYPIFMTFAGIMADLNDAYDTANWKAEITYASGKLADKESTWHLQKYSYPFDEPFSFIWFNESAPSAQPENESILFGDMGVTSFRYSWNETYPGAFFVSGPYEYTMGHVQSDQNSFAIRAYGEWLANDPGYNQRNTKKHNTITINGSSDQENTQSSNISEFFTSTFYDYVRGNASKAYNLTTDFFRTFIYIKPDYFFVFDDINLTGNYPVTWYLHSDINAEMRGNASGFTIEQPQALMKGRVIPSCDYTSQILTLGLTSSTEVQDTSYSEYLNITSAFTNNLTFLAVLYPQRNNNVLVLNRNMENSTDNITAETWTKRNNDCDYYIVTNESHSGDKSQVMHCEPTKTAYIWQNFTIVPGYYYNFTVWIKTNDTQQAYMQLGHTGYATAPKSTILKGQNEWTEITIANLTFNKSAAFILLYLLNGTAWYDDVSVVRTNNVIDDNATFVNKSISAIEIHYRNNSDIALINYTIGKKEINSSEGWFTCDGVFCLAGRDNNDSVNRIILHNGFNLTLNSTILFNSTVSSIVAFKINSTSYLGDIFMSNSGTVNIYVTNVTSFYINEVSSTSYNFTNNTISFDLNKGKNKIDIWT